MALGHWRYQKRSRCYWARRFLSQADGRTARSSLEQRYLMNFLVYFTDSADINKTLARHAKELLKTSDKRAGKFRMNLASINQCPEKWKLWCDMFTEQSNDHKEDEFLTTFLNSGASRSTLISVRFPCWCGLMFLQICNTPSTENEELYLLQIFSFLLLRALKPEGVLEFLKTLSWCTKDNAELLAFVLDIILSFEVITPISTHCETLLIVFRTSRLRTTVTIHLLSFRHFCYHWKSKKALSIVNNSKRDLRYCSSW